MFRFHLQKHLKTATCISLSSLTLRSFYVSNQSNCLGKEENNHHTIGLRRTFSSIGVATWESNKPKSFLNNNNSFRIGSYSIGGRRPTQEVILILIVLIIYLP